MLLGRKTTTKNCSWMFIDINKDIHKTNKKYKSSVASGGLVRPVEGPMAAPTSHEHKYSWQYAE